MAIGLDQTDVVVDLRPQVVGCHVRHRLRTQYPLVVQDAAVEQHLTKAQVIGNRSEVAGAAEIKLRLLVQQGNRLGFAVQRVVGKRLRQTGAFFLRHGKACIHHAQRLPHLGL